MMRNTGDFATYKIKGEGRTLEYLDAQIQLRCRWRPKDTRATPSFGALTRHLQRFFPLKETGELIG